MKTLRDRLAEWTDLDYACCEVGIALGIIPADSGSWGGKKWVFWASNPLGKTLYDIIEKLVAIGVLERREAASDTQYRWNPRFDWDQYGADQTSA